MTYLTKDHRLNFHLALVCQIMQKWVYFNAVYFQNLWGFHKKKQKMLYLADMTSTVASNSTKILEWEKFAFS